MVSNFLVIWYSLMGIIFLAMFIYKANILRTKKYIDKDLSYFSKGLTESPRKGIIYDMALMAVCFTMMAIMLFFKLN